MRIGGTSPSAIRPVTETSPSRGEPSDAQGHEHTLRDAARRPGTDLVAVERTARDVPRNSDGCATSALLNTQIIAQSLPARSDRRLARYFPDRAIAAYREHAALLDEAGRRRHRRSA